MQKLSTRVPTRQPDTATTAQRRRDATTPNPTDIHIGMRLRLRRMMIGLSQEEVADAVGVAFQQIQKYECAINRVSTSRLWEMSRVLQCPVSFFYEGLSGGVDAAAEDAAPDDSPGVSARQETLKLVRAYCTIRRPDTRRHILELASSLAGAAGGAPASPS